MNETELQEYMEFAKTLAKEAGDVMLRYFRADSLKTKWKQDNSPVTVADLEINSFVIQQVKKQYPSHGVIGEEESYATDREVVWVVDPIDGTAPYDLGMPCSTFCLALVHNGAVQVSVVLDPFQKRLFTAIVNQGTYCNDERIKVAPAKTIEHTYMFIPSDTKEGAKEEPYNYNSVITSVKKRGAKVSFLPSFTYLATMVLEQKALVCLMGYGSPWDAAAISLLAQEAGCEVSDLDGSARRYNEWGTGIVVANSAVHKEIIELLQDAYSRD
jgi:myo-inositol-1(or 4)-monophosphatase